VKILLVLISIISFIAVPLAKGICCMDVSKVSTDCCDDDKQDKSHSKKADNDNCMETCCLFVAEIQKVKTFNIVTKVITFNENYFLHLSKVKNIQIEIFKPPIFLNIKNT
jgi:hypothetical protein